jgi:hypothetical protein
MQTHPAPGCDPFRRFEAADPRADGGKRHIEVAKERIVIHRRVNGVAMKINVMAQTFKGVSLRLRATGAEGYTYQLALAHRDGDLTVVLEEAPDNFDIVANWRAWARFFGLPALVERRLGIDELERPMVGAVIANRPSPRRRGKWITARRPRFLVRRKVGEAKRMTAVEKRRVLFPVF